MAAKNNFMAYSPSTKEIVMVEAPDTLDPALIEVPQEVYSAVASLSTSTSAVEAGLSTLSSSVASLSTLVATLSTGESPVTESAVASLSTSTSSALSVTNSAQQTTDSNVASLSTEVSNVGSSVAVLSTSTSTAFSTVESGLGSLSSSSSTATSELGSSIASLSTSTSSKVTTAISSVESLSTSVSTSLSSVVSTIDSSVLGLGSSIASLSTSTSTGLSTTASSLLTTESLVYSSVSSLSTSTSTGLSAVESSVASLGASTSTGLSSVESSVASLSTSTSTAISDAVSSATSTVNSSVASLSTATSTGLSSTSSSVASLSTSTSTAISTAFSTLSADQYFQTEYRKLTPAATLANPSTTQLGSILLASDIQAISDTNNRVNKLGNLFAAEPIQGSNGNEKWQVRVNLDIAFAGAAATDTEFGVNLVRADGSLIAPMNYVRLNDTGRGTTIRTFNILTRTTSVTDPFFTAGGGFGIDVRVWDAATMTWNTTGVTQNIQVIFWREPKYIPAVALNNVVLSGTVTDDDPNTAASTHLTRQLYDSIQMLGAPTQWSAKQTTVITSTATAPTKATNRVHDYMRSRRVYANYYEVQHYYSSTVAAGAADGTGEYIFQLPSGLSFDLTEHPIYTGAMNSEITSYPFAVNEVVNGFASANGTYRTEVRIVPYTATTYRVACTWGDFELQVLGAANYRLAFAGVFHQWWFRIKTQQA